jgi:hypothetical protein
VAGGSTEKAVNAALRRPLLGGHTMTCGHTRSKSRSPFHVVTGVVVISIAYSATVFYVGFFLL